MFRDFIVISEEERDLETRSVSSPGSVTAAASTENEDDAGCEFSAEDREEKNLCRLGSKATDTESASSCSGSAEKEKRDGTKPSVFLCERSTPSKALQVDCTLTGKVTLTSVLFEEAKSKWPHLAECAVVVCDKCTPCKAVGNVRTARHARCLPDLGSVSSSLETPVKSLSLRTSTKHSTPDLFDSSFTIEHNQRKDVTEDKGKQEDGFYSGDELDLWSEDVDKVCDKIVSVGTSEHVDGSHRSDEIVNAATEMKTDIETDMQKEEPEIEEGSHDSDDDDVLVLSEEEVAKLPRSRTPSPVFCSQPTSLGMRNDQDADLTHNAEVKVEDSDKNTEGQTPPSSRHENAASDPLWVREHSTPVSRKPVKTYGFKRTRRLSLSQPNRRSAEFRPDVTDKDELRTSDGEERFVQSLSVKTTLSGHQSIFEHSFVTFS